VSKVVSFCSVPWEAKARQRQGKAMEGKQRVRRVAVRVLWDADAVRGKLPGETPNVQYEGQRDGGMGFFGGGSVDGDDKTQQTEENGVK
jgi:hypothetical protein